MASQQTQPQPSYILRGHGAQVHSTSFMRSNSRLLTGDADGWIVSWSLEIKRPVAVWKAHEGSILGILAWGPNNIITHGKDNKLIVWKLSEEDERSMRVVLPVDTPPDPRPQPWLLHLLQVNTMNFCSFAKTSIPSSDSSSDDDEQLLVAVPNTLTSETVDIFHLPSSKRIHTIPKHPSFKGGMIMTISLFHHPLTNHLTVIAGFESGHTTISQLIPSTNTWQPLYISQAHTQPVLSLDVDPTKKFYLTSSADAIIAKHPIPENPSPSTFRAMESTPLKIVQTKHSGQQNLQMRSDGRIFATAGWDSKVRVYSSKTVKELAVLKWHKEGCFAVAFAEVKGGGDEGEGQDGKEIVRSVEAMTVKEKRIWKARNAHWIAVGSKDGKVSLWDVY
ncbi:hypothetical protein HYALB_00003387 [Hymenoscyphus albidus]|uniref:ASTRA-associated protein 1 n=1 Tax=Hymenoscyphus albidus TaxID=595503 RepID=A0A9N9LTB1_9HELO|nr:hypothetical protein HYALB_00003387 [Hymenoscyphus albidus]